MDGTRAGGVHTELQEMTQAIVEGRLEYQV